MIPTDDVYAPPTDPRDPNASNPTGLRTLGAAFLLVAAIPAALFVASQPLAGVAGFATLGVLFVGTRGTVGTVRRLRNGRSLRVDLPGGVRLRVDRHPEAPREERAPEF